MKLIIWTVNGIGALQMIQTRRIWWQRMPWTLQFAVASATKPKFAQLLIFGVQITLGVHKFHFNLQRDIFEI